MKREQFNVGMTVADMLEIGMTGVVIHCHGRGCSRRTKVSFDALNLPLDFRYASIGEMAFVCTGCGSRRFSVGVGDGDSALRAAHFHG